MKVRVRFAPSPTGIPHVGSMRTVLFNYFFAKKNKGDFILRIEDTDQARKVEGAIDAIHASLDWLGIKCDEQFIQSERLSEYKKYAEELIEKGLARHDEGAIRFNVLKEGVTSWIDLIGNKKIEFKNSEIEDFIILKADGFPTYHLANVVDDHLMNISHVIRGDDWIPSAPKHLMLYQALEWKAPEFAHLPNVLGTDNKKLSKRRGAKSVLDFKKDGFLAEAVLNYLMLLGFSPKDNREILSRDEFEKDFDLAKVNVAPAVFDEKKLLWMNGVYLRNSSHEDLQKLLADYYSNDKEILEYINNVKVLELAKSRIFTLADFKKLVLKQEGSGNNEITKELSDKLSSLESWNKDEIFGVFKMLMEKHKIRMPVLYKIFTGSEHGLPLSDFLESIGQAESLKRLK